MRTDILKKSPKELRVPGITLNKADFYTDKLHVYGLTISLGNRFKKDILPHIPDKITCPNICRRLFETYKKGSDMDVDNDLEGVKLMSIEEYAAVTASIVIYCRESIKTNGFSNLQYVMLSDGRISVARLRIIENTCFISSYMFGKGKSIDRDSLVIVP